jgi:hypothetical protein
MKRVFPVAVLCAILLGACAHPRHGFGVRYGDPRAPQLTVVNGQIQIGPEVLVFLPGQQNVTITWTLPGDSALRFADNGIVIEGQILEQVIKGERPSALLDPRQQEIVDCRRGDKGLTFSCVNRHSKPGVFKYTIRLLDGNKVIERDPFIANM